MSIQQGSGFSSRPVCCQDPGNSGEEWLRLVAGALQGSTNSSAEEPDHWTGEKLGGGHSVCSPEEKEPHWRACVDSSSVTSGAGRALPGCFLWPGPQRWGAAPFASFCHSPWCLPPLLPTMVRLHYNLCPLSLLSTSGSGVKSVCPHWGLPCYLSWIPFFICQ